MKVSYKTSKKLLQKSLQQNNGVLDRLLLQNGPWESPRQVPEPPRQPQGSRQGVKGVSRQPLWLLFGSPRPPLWVSGCPLALPRCLQELFWEIGDPKCLDLKRFGTQISIQNRGLVSHVSNIYYPFLPWLCFLIWGRWGTLPEYTSREGCGVEVQDSRKAASRNLRRRLSNPKNQYTFGN